MSKDTASFSSIIIFLGMLFGSYIFGIIGDKKFVKDIPKQFEVVWNRKREFLQGNLEKSFEREEMIALAERYAKEGKGYASKLTLMEMQRGIMR